MRREPVDAPLSPPRFPPRLVTGRPIRKAPERDGDKVSRFKIAIVLKVVAFVAGRYGAVIYHRGLFILYLIKSHAAL